MAFHYTIPITVIGLLLCYYLFTKVLRYWRISSFRKEHGCLEPPVIPGSGLIGYGLVQNMKKNITAQSYLAMITNDFKKLGNTWTADFFTRHYIMTIEPENIKAILSTKFEDFGLGTRLAEFTPLLTGGIFVSDGAQWQHSRSLVRPSFTRNQVADLEAFETHVQRLISTIPTDGSTVDLMPLFFHLTLNVAMEFLLGQSPSVGGAEEATQELFSIAFDLAQMQLDQSGRTGIKVWIWPNRPFFRAVEIVHAFVNVFVQKALDHRVLHPEKELDKHSEKETKSSRYVFLDGLTKATDDPVQMRNELLNVLLAGRDTTGSTLTSVFHVLARRPDIWAKLKAEVDLLGGDKPEYETLRNMKYLKYILNETLRLYPPVPGNSRQAIRDTFLPLGGGPDGKSPVFVPKGQSVNYFIWSMHRLHPTYGDDGEEFRPERWESLRPGWEYLPFNGGPRICVGQQFALTEVGYTTVRIVQAFSAIECRDERPWMENLSLTVCNSNGAKVAFRV